MAGKPGGWADQHGHEGQDRPRWPGPVWQGGVTLTNMPAARQPQQQRHIKGLPGPTSDADEDHQPGGGAWYEVAW